MYKSYRSSIQSGISFHHKKEGNLAICHNMRESRESWGHYAKEKNKHCVCVCAKSLQSCLTFCDPMDSSPPGSSVHEILQARLLEWVAMPFSRGSSRPRDRTHVSCGSCLAGGFFTAEPLGKAENKRVLSKLSGNRWVVLCIFPLWFHFSVFWLMFLLFLSQASSCSQWEDRLI